MFINTLLISGSRFLFLSLCLFPFVYSFRGSCDCSPIGWLANIPPHIGNGFSHFAICGNRFSFIPQWDASAKSVGKKVRVNTVAHASKVAVARIRLFKVHPPIIHLANEGGN